MMPSPDQLKEMLDWFESNPVEPSYEYNLIMGLLKIDSLEKRKSVIERMRKQGKNIRHLIEDGREMIVVNDTDAYMTLECK